MYWFVGSRNLEYAQIFPESEYMGLLSSQNGSYSDERAGSEKSGLMQRDVLLTAVRYGGAFLIHSSELSFDSPTALILFFKT